MFIKDIPGIDLLQIGRIGSKDSDHKSLQCIAIITYKTPYIVSRQLVVVFFGFGGGVACNTIFSYFFLSALKTGTMFKSMTMTCGRISEVFWLEAMVSLAVV